MIENYINLYEWYSRHFFPCPKKGHYIWEYGQTLFKGIIKFWERRLVKINLRINRTYNPLLR